MSSDEHAGSQRLHGRKYRASVHSGDEGRKTRSSMGMGDAPAAMAPSTAELGNSVLDLAAVQEKMQHQFHEAFARQEAAQHRQEAALGKVLEMMAQAQGSQQKSSRCDERGNGPSASASASSTSGESRDVAVESILDDRGLRELLEQDKASCRP